MRVKKKIWLDPERHVHGLLALGDLVLDIGDIRKKKFITADCNRKLLTCDRKSLEVGRSATGSCSELIAKNKKFIDRKATKHQGKIMGMNAQKMVGR